jgi:NAD(P)-dependent dehydrogenase (short-subunit alcohol dehydrogenase family)
MDLRLSNRVALVTGGSKGIGLAIVRTLLEEGTRVAVASRSVSPELGALAGPSLLHVPSDLFDNEAPADAVERAVREFGGLDIVVNNHGGPPPGVRLPRFSFTTPTDADWRAMFEFNVFSVVRVVRAAIPHLLKSDAAAIVNVSSGAARQPAPMNYDYNSAKAALNNVTKALSQEYGPQGIRVNTVSPGPVRTDWWTREGGAADILAERFGADRDRVMSEMAPEMMGLATGRLVEPEEVADAVALLVSPRSRSTVGAEFVVDGGYLKEI